MFQDAIDFSVGKVRAALDEFTDFFPGPQSENYVYQQTKNSSWTEGFWTGMVWLAYEFTKDDVFRKVAEHHVQSFKDRIEALRYVNHHDMGFLYSPSCVAAYKLTGNEDAKKAAILAADNLISRYQPVGEFIQAWGELGAENNYRLIIDCLLNIPLLYWATSVTGDPKYAEIATKHCHTCINCVIRDDFTTYHTYYFDKKTGAPLRGVTAQGYSNDSCWARGQAWGVYGLAISYAYTKNEKIIPLFNGVTQKFIDQLPADKVPYWDMIFTSGDEPRDTSSAAIAACGILQMDKYVKNEKFVQTAIDMIDALNKNYRCGENSNGILTDAMYSRPDGHKPECNIWGDYYFMEALMRLNNPDWNMYW